MKIKYTWFFRQKQINYNGEPNAIKDQNQRRIIFGNIGNKIKQNWA